MVPLLQKRGVFRTECEGDTLRDFLGLRQHRRRRAGGYTYCVMSAMVKPWSWMCR